MTRGFNKHKATCVVANSGTPVAANAPTISVSAAGATDFPLAGTFSVEVVATGLVLEITSGAGTTTWTVGTWGADGTTGLIANVPDGAALEEILTANDLLTFVQRTENAVPTPMLATTTPIVAGTGAVGTSTLAARADHVHPAIGAGAADATTSSVGVVEVDQAPSGAHPVALTTDGIVLPAGLLSSTTPVADGTATVGTIPKAALADHVHPLPRPPVVAKVANYTIAAADHTTHFLANASGIVFTLPVPATAGTGFSVTIKNKNQTTTGVKTNTAGVLIDGVDCSSTAYTTGLTTSWGKAIFITDGVSWFTV